nr:hypothetical protein [Pyrinomonadaceae bacterium]
MKKSSLAANLRSFESSLHSGKDSLRSKNRILDEELFNEKLQIIQQKLEEGLSGEVETLSNQLLDKFALSPEQSGKIHCKLSSAYEMFGRYKESLEIISEYEEDEKIEQVSEELGTEIWIQMAIAHNNLGD